MIFEPIWTYYDLRHTIGSLLLKIIRMFCNVQNVAENNFQNDEKKNDLTLSKIYNIEIQSLLILKL